MCPWKRKRQSPIKWVKDQILIIKATIREKDSRMEPYLSESSVFAIFIIAIVIVIWITSHVLTRKFYSGKYM